jgi:hypothetical protein
MTDKQLSRDLQALQSDDYPNPAFADALFAELEDEVLARRRSGRVWVLLAAAALIAAVATGAVVGSGLVRVPWLVADASPTLQPQSTATAVPSPSAEPSTPTATPVPTTAPAVGGVVRITATGLSLRKEPGLDGVRMGGLAGGGTQAYVVEGPRVEDGYEWYQLAGLGIPPNSGCAVPPVEALDECPSWFGWVAGREVGAEFWLEPTALDCRPSPLNLLDLAAGRGDIGRLACYQGGSVTVRSWWPELPEGIGFEGACAGYEHPSGWLYCQNLNFVEIFDNDQGLDSGIGLHVNLDPSNDVTMPTRGTWVEIVGHFDDPAADGCAEAATLSGDDQDPDQIVLACRAELVVDSVTAVRGPF